MMLAFFMEFAQYVVLGSARGADPSELLLQTAVNDPPGFASENYQTLNNLFNNHSLKLSCCAYRCKIE